MRKKLSWLSLRRWLPVGTLSLLIGVHQIIWHPYTVWRAWRFLYGPPSWRELVCIIIHDWGYWGKPNMDGPEGERHPETAAKLAGWLHGEPYRDLVLYHSRHYARAKGVKPSRLCWADKLSIYYEPRWWYLLRARLSGELSEYRRNAWQYVPFERSDEEWFGWIKQHLVIVALQRRGDAMPYQARSRSVVIHD